MDSIKGIQAGKIGGDRQTQFRTYDSFAGLKDRLDQVDMKQAKGLIPYIMNNQLVIPDNPIYGCIPPGAKLLPVNNGALKNIVDNFLDSNSGDEGHTKLDNKEMVFIKGGVYGELPNVVIVGARGTNVSFPYNKQSGEPA